MKNLKHGIIAIALAALLAGCGSTSGSGDDSSKSNAKPDIKVEASKIIKEFEQNEASADAKYKGKVLQVSGVVSKVDTDMFNDEEYIIRLNGGQQFALLDVNCNGISAKVAGGIKTKKPITVIGAFDDGGDLGIELKNCRVA